MYVYFLVRSEREPLSDLLCKTILKYCKVSTNFNKPISRMFFFFTT